LKIAAVYLELLGPSGMESIKLVPEWLLRPLVPLLFGWTLLLAAMASAQDGQSLPNPFDFLERTGNESEAATVQAEVAEAVAPEAAALDGLLGDAALPQQPGGDGVLRRAYKRAYVIEVEGAIFGRFHWYLNQRLDHAREIGADLVVVHLTSPGGDMEQSLQLARRLRDVDWATTVAYIPSQAISGGAIIALGCDRIYMKDGALIGDAGPIQMGLDGQFQHAEEKVVSFLASAVRELAKAKGRPPAVAEAMVDRSVVLFSATERETGKPTILTEAETKAEGAQEKYQIGQVVPESGNNRFLTVSAARARDLLLSDGVVADERAMLNQFDVKQVERTSMTWIDKTVYLLNRPWLTVLLLLVGLVGLYFELAAPGISVAGLVALLCFGIFFWSHALGGTSGWLEVLLFMLGVVCLVCEIFVLPGFGVFGLTGLALVALSLIMASQDFIVPTDGQQWAELQYNSVMVLGVILAVVVLGFVQVIMLDSIPGLNRFRLAIPGQDVDVSPDRAFSLAASAPSSAIQISPGEQGTADSDLRPSGKVMLAGRLVDVVTEGDYVDAGSSVEVIRVEGNRVVVRRTQA
jgi:membrane-bound serine protease (ClpP class)